MTIHPRVCLHQVAFAAETTSEFIAYCREVGIAKVTLAAPYLLKPGGLQEAKAALAAGGPQVGTVNHVFGAYPNLAEDHEGEATAKLLEAIDAAAELGAPVIYLISGGRGDLTWEAAADRFAELIAPCRKVATDKRIALLVETASDFNVDIHMAHTLDDTIELAQIAGIGVCIELHACWFEAHLKRKFARAMPLTGLVQVSDYVLGDRTAPCRAVPGDGAIPLEHLLGDLIEAGYDGLFDLELLGPRVEAEGPRAAALRGAENISEILYRLGA